MAITVGSNDFVRIGRVVHKAICQRYDNEHDAVAVHDIGCIDIIATAQTQPDRSAVSRRGPVDIPLLRGREDTSRVPNATAR